MAKLVQKSGYIKSEKAGGYMKYIATREGVEKLTGNGPVTKGQRELIQKLLHDFPDAVELFEYEDYRKAPTLGTASAFITMALDANLHEINSESGYMSYIATRPRVERCGTHGLFSSAAAVDLDAAMSELEAHDGNVWTIIYSLRREDAARLGYDNADAWRGLLMLGAFAQAESESISANVRWGKRQAMREGKTIIQYIRLYAYEKGEDGKPKIIQEQADVVRSIYDQYLSGASLRMIKDRLEAEQIPNVTGGSQWTITAIRSILTNEKYCGDVLLQKTYISDCISRKVIRNTGQLPMYLVQNHHEGIVERKTFDAVQAEMARRSAGKSPSKKNAPTGMTSYASKYALSERLVCGECGTLYRRCTWSKQGRKRIVWRCVSRLDYGTKYCHNSPTLDEEPLQKAILAAINSVMSQKSTLIRQITSAMEMELAPVPGESMSLADIERLLGELNDQTRELVAESARAEDASACTAQLRAVMNEAAVLKEKRALIEEQRQSNAQAVRRIEDAAAAMAQASTHISEWDEALIRQLVDTVKVNSAEKITVFLRGGIQVEQDMI